MIYVQGDIFDYWGAIAGAIGIVGAVVTILAYRYARRGGGVVKQTMTNSEHSSQTATRDNVEQEMTDSKGGSQNA